MKVRFLAVFVPLALGCAGVFGTTEGRNPSECADDADNDGDGLFDCSDPDCAGSAACTEDGDGSGGSGFGDSGD
jgi:hypothetical protein